MGLASARATDRRDWWFRISLWLVGGTLAYNVIEAVVAVWFGAEADSVALLGFGLDSVIETLAGVLVLWRLTAEVGGRDAEQMERIEVRVHRFVGITFLLLAAYVGAQAGFALSTQQVPEASPIGILLAVASLLIMPLLSWGKLRAAREIGSSALRAEAMETLACSYLSLTLLLGLAANAALSWWWADSVAALLMVPWLIKEGREGLRGEGCCC
ncbi:MAG: cation transporter [Bdellovibrionales bacterium]|nr:cation transporter [Bdellovibrionales bacterium]